jgi:hypothetical protein
LVEKEQVKGKIKKKIFDLCKKNDKLVLLQSRYEEINNLIIANKKSETLKVDKIQAQTGKLDYSQGYAKKKRAFKARKNSKLSDSQTARNKIRIPFYVYPLKNQRVNGF